MEGFADLLTDAFSEGSVPSFSTGDLDFESLCFDEKSEEEQNKNPEAENDEARLQEASADGAASLQGPDADAPNSDENSDKEQTDEETDEEGLHGACFSSETPEDDECPSSEEEEEQSNFCSGRGGEEEAEDPEEEEDRLKSLYETVDGILEDEDSEILEDVDELQVSNKLQEEEHSDEEEDRCRNANTEESPESEEEQEVEPDSSESDYEGVKTEEEEKEEPSNVDPADFGLECSCMSLQNLQDLISEVDDEVYGEKMSDFTGEEHQEAGESFADYPSDFSSGEYGRNAAAARSPREEAGLGRAETESVWSLGSEEAGSGKEEEFLFSRDIELNVEKMMMSLDEAAGDEVERKTEHLLRGTSFDDEEKTSESDSYSSSEDEEPLRRSSDVFSDKSRTRVLEDDTNLENIKSLGASGSDDGSFVRDRHDPAEFLTSGLGELETKTFLYEFFLGGEDADGTESHNSGRNQCPDQDINSYTVVEKKDSIPASPFVQGSIDDSFFFNTEPNDFTDDGQQEEEEEDEEEEDEYEERRNFEQMKQRIEAFKKFYDNCDDENGRRERQIKVQFCADPLSQVNYYETDSSDRDSVSSSSDREEDLSSAEQSDDNEEDLNPAEQSEDKEEDLNPAEQSEDNEEDLNPAEQSEDKEEDLNPAEQSKDKEEDLNPAEQSEDKEEDLNPAEQSEDKEEDLNPAEQSEDKEEDLNPAEQSEDTEDDLSTGEQFGDKDEDSSSAEQSDEPWEPEEDPDIKPVFDPPIVQQHQSPADVVNTQTCTATRKSFSTLKTIATLGVLTATGLMMFYMTTDQPDWLRQFLFF